MYYPKKLYFKTEQDAKKYIENNIVRDDVLLYMGNFHGSASVCRFCRISLEKIEIYNYGDDADNKYIFDTVKEARNYQFSNIYNSHPWVYIKETNEFCPFEDDGLIYDKSSIYTFCDYLGFMSDKQCLNYYDQHIIESLPKDDIVLVKNSPKKIILLKGELVLISRCDDYQITAMTLVYFNNKNNSSEDSINTMVYRHISGKNCINYKHHIFSIHEKYEGKSVEVKLIKPKADDLTCVFDYKNYENCFDLYKDIIKFMDFISR